MTERQRGLTAAEVAQSRQEHGENVLTPPKRQSMWRLYLEKYQDPMVRILLVAAVVSLLLSLVKNDFIETIGIIAAIILATTVGFVFERDAARKFDMLNQLGEEQLVKVVRRILSSTPSPKGEENHVGLNLGAGIEYEVNEHFGVNLEYRHTIIRKVDQGVVSLGLNYKF